MNITILSVPDFCPKCRMTARLMRTVEAHVTESVITDDQLEAYKALGFMVAPIVEIRAGEHTQRIADDLGILMVGDAAVYGDLRPDVVKKLASYTM